MSMVSRETFIALVKDTSPLRADWNRLYDNTVAFSEYMETLLPGYTKKYFGEDTYDPDLSLNVVKDDVIRVLLSLDKEGTIEFYRQCGKVLEGCIYDPEQQEEADKSMEYIVQSLETDYEEWRSVCEQIITNMDLDAA